MNQFHSYREKVIHKVITDIKQYYILLLCLITYITLGAIFRFTICPVRLLTGIPCPGCGITRSLRELLHGHLAEAFHLHPFIYIIIASVLIICILHYFTDVSLKWVEHYLTVIGGLMIVFYIYRMVRFFPNQEPMTYNKASLAYFLYHSLFQ